METIKFVKKIYPNSWRWGKGRVGVDQAVVVELGQQRRRLRRTITCCPAPSKVEMLAGLLLLDVIETESFEDIETESFNLKIKLHSIPHI
uniref:Uncharacterized protein n=1 Tax=Betula platyphylla TaxID=78630 RepID=A0A5B9G545_BETPL|nr:hypothetical protein [Betula platyphylla]